MSVHFIMSIVKTGFSIVTLICLFLILLILFADYQHYAETAKTYLDKLSIVIQKTTRLEKSECDRMWFNREMKRAQ